VDDFVEARPVLATKTLKSKEREESGEAE